MVVVDGMVPGLIFHRQLPEEQMAAAELEKSFGINQ